MMTHLSKVANHFTLWPLFDKLSRTKILTSSFHLFSRLPLNDKRNSLIPKNYLLATANELFIRENFVYTLESQRELRKRKFTNDEDQVILADAETYGDSLKTWKDCAQKLDRKTSQIVRKRYMLLISNGSKGSRKWQLSEDKTLLEIILKDQGKKMNGIDGLNSVKWEDFQESDSRNEFDFPKGIQHNWLSCWVHWQRVLFPILKTHVLGLPQNLKWRKDVVNYLVDNKVEKEEDIHYDKVLKKVCPGQTVYSLRNFVFSQRQTKVKGKSIVLKEPLHYIISKRLGNPSSSSFLKNEKMARRNLEFANDIVKMYSNLTATKSTPR